MKLLKKRLLCCIFSLILVVVLAIGGICAWFVQSRIPKVDGFKLNVVNLSGSVSDVIDITTTIGQADNPASFYPGDNITETLTLINRTDSWMKINLKMIAVGIKYNGEYSNNLIDPVIMAEGEEVAPFLGDGLTLNEFVAPLTNACKVIVHPFVEGMVTYSQFNYITHAKLASEQQKNSSEYNMVPMENITGLNIFTTTNRSFSLSTLIYAYFTTEGDIYLKGGYNLELALLMHFDPFAYSTATYTDNFDNLITVKEKSSNPFCFQHIRLVLGADITSVQEDDLPSI